MNKIINKLFKCTLQINSNNLRLDAAKYCSYKSDISLESLYPNSKTKIYTPALPIQQSADDKFNGYIPLDKVEITYSRSSGPGGQNVNCVNTKVDLRVHIESANWMPKVARERFLNEHKSKLSKDGYFIVRSDLTRSQHMNLADAMERLRNFIRTLEKPDKMELSVDTLERIRRKREKAARERLMIKRERSTIKQQRQNNNIEL